MSINPFWFFSNFLATPIRCHQYLTKSQKLASQPVV